MNVLAAGIEKLTSGDSESVGKLKSLQVNDAPGLFTDAEIFHINRTTNETFGCILKRNALQVSSSHP